MARSASTERVLAEAGVVLLREREQLVAGVAAGAEDGVDVDESRAWARE
jgi:hypothetical protein